MLNVLYLVFTCLLVGLVSGGFNQVNGVIVVPVLIVGVGILGSLLALRYNVL